MALAHVANRGALSAKAAGASLDLVLAAGQGIGLDRLVLVWAAWDNSDNVDDATTRLSASDEVANTYTPVVEQTQGGGAAAAGVTAFLAAAVTSTAPEEGDFIRVTSNDATRVAKVLSVAEFSKTPGSTIVVAAVDAGGGTGGGAFAPALADLPERPYLFAGGLVFERGDHASLGFDQDDDYTSIGFASTLGGAANSNLSLFGGFRIATATGDTWGISVGAAAGECAHFLAAFYEVEDGGEDVEGTSVVSGGGDVASSGAKGAAAAGSTSGAGGSGSEGEKGALEGSNVSGAGATASSGSKAAEAASSASAAGSITSSGQKNASASSAVSGGGHVTSTGSTLEARSGSSAVSGGGSATSSGAKGGRGASSVPGGGAVITVAVKGAFSTSTVSAGGVVTTVATSARFAASLVSGGGDVVTQTFAGAPAAPPATTRTHAGTGPTGRTLAGFATGRTHAGAGSGKTGSEIGG